VLEEFEVRDALMTVLAGKDGHTIEAFKPYMEMDRGL
jgi:hypothetical protein